MRLAHTEIVSQQFSSILHAGIATLSKTILFLASQIFQAIATKMVAHCFLCCGCGLVIESCTVLTPSILDRENNRFLVLVAGPEILLPV
jgi:hypothetical protein